jgi:hypothetical protein
MRNIQYHGAAMSADVLDVLQGTASVQKGGQSKDHRDSVMINYRNSDAVILRPMLDELRRVRLSFPSV